MSNPLLAAVVAELPPIGMEFAADRRSAWLQMFRSAVDVVYGPTCDDAPVLSATFAVPAVGPQSRYWIAPDGTALRDRTPIDAHDIPPGTIVDDFRPQPPDEFSPIMWGSSGARPMPLPRGVMLAPATGDPPAMSGGRMMV